MTWLASTPQLRREQFGRFVLGTGNLGGVAATTGPGIGLSEREGVELLERAVREQFKIIDTSDVYAGGASEQIVGVWNRSHPAPEVLIQTKTGATPEGPNLSPERIVAQLARSIATIGRVDLYVAHLVDPNTPWAESLPAFSTAIEIGQIRGYGLSNVNEAALTAALETADRLQIARPEVIQNSYSLLVRDDDTGVLPIVSSEGLAYTPYSPLSYGILAGRYRHGDAPQKGSRASTGPRADGFLNDPNVMQKVEKFSELADAAGISPAGLALAWLINQPLVTAPIVGLSKESHWQGLHEALALNWTEQLETGLREAFRES
jgi:1-deoxyxylulose-5-phosphate synthase